MFPLSREYADWDRTISLTRSSGDQEINLVGILKGDVTGSWEPPAGSNDLDEIAPTYFRELSLLLGAPLDQWHA